MMFKLNYDNKKSVKIISNTQKKPYKLKFVRRFFMLLQ